MVLSDRGCLWGWRRLCRGLRPTSGYQHDYHEKDAETQSGCSLCLFVSRSMREPKKSTMHLAPLR